MLKIIASVISGIAVTVSLVGFSNSMACQNYQLAQINLLLAIFNLGCFLINKPKETN